MQAALRELADIDFRLADATLQLHEQQELVGSIDCGHNHVALLTLLSNVLRQFHQLEQHRLVALEILFERTATLRNSCPTKHTALG